MCARDKMGQTLQAFADGGRPPPEGKGGRMLQYYRLKIKHNLRFNSSPQTYKPDWMTLMATYTKILLDKTNQILKKMSSKTRTSSRSLLVPNSILFTCIVTILSVFLTKQYMEPSLHQHTGLWKFLYIVSLATHFGTMIWMSFISGIILYFSLPRHVFGQVQQYLFPAYYVHNSIMAFITVISFIQIQPKFQLGSSESNQLALLLVVFFIEAIIRLYISQHIVRLKHIKTEIESQAGTGQEIGEHIIGELVNCPHYMKILKSFRKLHSITAVGNITVVMCSLFHVYYLANKLCL